MKKNDITPEDIKNLYKILGITENNVVNDEELVTRIYSFQDTSDTVTHNHSKITQGNSLNIAIPQKG